MNAAPMRKTMSPTEEERNLPEKKNESGQGYRRAGPHQDKSRRVVDPLKHLKSICGMHLRPFRSRGW
jgi:hypothetical protein